MKKLLLILSICLAFSCKKKNDVDEITQYNWPLQSATVSPALQINGVAVTNFKGVEDGSSCLNSNYTLSFSADGSFAFTSTGALCDMISYHNAKWTKNGNEIILNTGYGPNETVILNGKMITQTHTFEKEGKTYTVTYIFTAKAK